MSTLVDKDGILYLRYYDKYKKRTIEKSLKMKSNRDGWIEGRKFQKEFDKRLDAILLESKFQLKRSTELKLSQVFPLYERQKKLDNEDLAKNSVTAYQLAIEHFKKACGDRKLYSYTADDYLIFKDYLNKHKYKGELISEQTKANYIRHIAAIFSFCQSNGWVKENYIKRIEPQKKKPKAIPDQDLKAILQYLYNKKPEKKFAKKFEYRKWFNIIYFMYLSGFRKSSATRLRWQDIDFEERVIHATNVKGKRTFDFPLHKVLYDFLVSIGPKPEGSVFGFSDDDRLKFFYRIQLEMKLNKTYTIHQLRKSFASFASKNDIPDDAISLLLDHTDNKTAREHYIERYFGKLKAAMDRMEFITIGVPGKSMVNNARAMGIDVCWSNN